MRVGDKSRDKREKQVQEKKNKLPSNKKSALAISHQNS